MSAHKDQTIENLVAAVGAADHEVDALASWTGERCFAQDGTPVVLWTYAEMFELAQTWLTCKAGELE